MTAFWHPTGLVAARFVPPKPIRAHRNLTRYRKALIGERQREANRLHKILEDAGIKLECVASDILGLSGRAMLEALVAGTTDPQLLSELTRGRLRAKIPALREADVGRFDAQHALIVSAILAHLDFLDEQVALLSEAIEEQIAPFAAALELLRTIPGSRLRRPRILPPPVQAHYGRHPGRVPAQAPAPRVRARGSASARRP